MTCGICSGPLRLRYRGDPPELVADAFAPSCHSVSGYADLYACERCGTVQQPDLPTGAELHDLYRGMRDDAYLAEEAGRRANAAAPARRDRAPRRRAGACSRSAAATGCCSTRRAPAAGASRASRSPHASREHARSLGLDVRDQTLEAGRRRVRRGRARRRARAPRRPRRRAAPDRGAARARRRDADRHPRPRLAHRPARRLALVGLPAVAHLPDPARRRSASCSATPGWRPVEERHFWRTFSFGYWIAGLGERSGPVRSAVKAVEKAGLGEAAADDDARRRARRRGADGASARRAATGGRRARARGSAARGMTSSTSDARARRVAHERGQQRQRHPHARQVLAQPPVARRVPRPRRAGGRRPAAASAARK